jgi:hypothetical protein
LVLPSANTEAMHLHLEEISKHVAGNAHGVVQMDRAGCHTTGLPSLIRNEILQADAGGKADFEIEMRGACGLGEDGFLS